MGASRKTTAARVVSLGGADPWSPSGRSLAMALAIALLLGGCRSTSHVSYTPEIAGIIATREPGPNGSSIRITLRDGHSQTIDINEVHVVAGKGYPDVGELF